MLSKIDFEIIEGRFHDGLGTFAELALANELISAGKLNQSLFDLFRCTAKMEGAIDGLPQKHLSRFVFQREILSIRMAAKKGAEELLGKAKPASLVRVKHVPQEYVGAKARDLMLEFDERSDMPVSVKTDKSGKIAVAEGQTPDISQKWANRYLDVSEQEMERAMQTLGFYSMRELKSYYLNVSKLVAHLLIRKLGLVDCAPTDFKNAKITNLESLKYMLRQLLLFKKGNDGSAVIILDRSTGNVKWESLLDAVDIDQLTSDRISFLPSRPRGERVIGSEFGIKIDGRTVVSFQIKHKRGSARGTSRQYEFSDITTRLRV